MAIHCPVRKTTIEEGYLMGIIGTSTTDTNEDIHEGTMISAGRLLFDASYFRFQNSIIATNTKQIYLLYQKPDLRQKSR
jgi:hypothetical protein